MKRTLTALVFPCCLGWMALGTAWAQTADCGQGWAVIHGGDPSPFPLPKGSFPKN